MEADVLGNGLRLATVGCPGSPLAAVVLRVGVGSADERLREHGIAHALEHLVVRCALDGGRVADGAVVQARTDRSRTVFSVLVHAADLAAAVAAVGSVFCDLEVPAAELADELAAMREERRQRSAEPAWHVQNALFGAWWAGTGAEHPVFGDPAVLDALTPARLAAFHAAWYQPVRATLAIAADPGVLAAAWPETAKAAADWRGGGGVGTPRTPSTSLTPPTPLVALRPARIAAAAGWGPASGLGCVFGGGEPEATILACDAVGAAGGPRIATAPLRGWSCMWAVLTGVRADEAKAGVLDALGAAKRALAAPGGVSWLCTEAVIPRLRTEAAIEAIASRAADPRLLIDVDRLRRTPPASVARILDVWSRRLGSIGPDRDSGPDGNNGGAT